MHATDPDDLVPFPDVRVVRSTAPALLCQIGARTVWLPRRHISGKLWCTGDRGRLYIRRWVARDRHLLELHEHDVLHAVPDGADLRCEGAYPRGVPGVPTP
jgi:hypothetical protein